MENKLKEMESIRMNLEKDILQKDLQLNEKDLKIQSIQTNLQKLESMLTEKNLELKAQSEKIQNMEINFQTLQIQMKKEMATANEKITNLKVKKNCSASTN